MISVCIATHNGAHYIKEQIESVLCQLGPKDEIIISDDGSNDKTIEILLAFNDKRIIICSFKQPKKSKHSHIYVCKNFENALKHAKGDYIFLADQDDWWMPNKVEKCIEALKYNILVVHRAEICDRNLYKDVDDKATQALKGGTESDVFAKRKSTKDKLKELIPDLNI